MDVENWKPFYQKRGTYKDGRERICIAWYSKDKMKKTFMLPKPEELLEILKRVPFDSTQKEGDFTKDESVL